MTEVANALKHPCLKAIRDLPSTEASLNLSVLIWQVCLFYLYFNNKTHFLFKGKVYYLIRVFKPRVIALHRDLRDELRRHANLGELLKVYYKDLSGLANFFFKLTFEL